MNDDDKEEIIPSPLFFSNQTMSIGIAAPSSVPFVVGGAEKLWWGLQEYINKNTIHNCELIKICAREDSFRDLINTYFRFYHLDLLHFDMVISTKYPAWMIRHPNHHVYFQHPLRGLYELYHGPESLSREARTHPGVKKVLDALEGDVLEIQRLLDCCLDLSVDPSAPAEALAFPGPLIRRIVHTLDHHAIRHVTRVAAISRTVRERSGYFPNPDDVRVVHHPSNLQGFHNAGGEYLLTASRLVHSKRIHLILEAYMQAKLDIPLKIVGRGPEMLHLRKMAAGNKRIQFTGFVSDCELVELYSRALAVVFIPENEDLGLITLEAMHSGKPVITCTDSGGSTELVQHGQTGWICPPDASEVKRAMQEAAADFQKTASMGNRAREQVLSVSWENLVRALFDENGVESAATPKKPSAIKAKTSGRPALTVLSTFPVYPPWGGGQIRIYHLYRALAADFDIHLVSLGPARDRATSLRIAPGFLETRVPMPYAFLKQARKLGSRLGISAVDMAVLFYPELLPELTDAVATAADGSDLVVFSHPYTLRLAEKHTLGKRVYDAHNVEYDIKKASFSSAFREDRTLGRLKEIEAEVCKTSLCTMACSEADIARLCELYALDQDRVLLVPNGVDTFAIAFTPPEQRETLQKSLDLKHRRVAVFMGSFHPPNIDAAEQIIRMAESLPQYRFVIIGSVADYFTHRPYPANVGFTGEIAEAEKALYLACAHVALNPVRSGSGTNLKMLEYIAAGLPVISTRFGARGLDASCVPVLIKKIDDFPSALNRHGDIDTIHWRLAGSGREMIEKNYCWNVIGRKVSGRLKKIMADGGKT